MRRWFFRILTGLAIVIVVLIVIVQVVLWSPLPKRIVIRQIESELGLRISADSLSTGWLGRSTLTNVSLGLPLSSDDFLKVKSLKIKHSSLIGLALGHVEVESIEIDDPVVEVVQDAQGQWNVQQVIELLGRVAGGSGGMGGASGQNQPADNSIPTLPNFKLVNGSVHITDNLNRSLSLEPLNVAGAPSGALVWDYDLTIADSIAMKGKVAPGGNWRHQVTLSVHDLDSLLKNFGVPTTYAATVKSQWDGQITDGKLIGTLSLNQATAGDVPMLGDVSIAGSVDIDTDGSAVTLRPNQLDLKTTNVTVPDVAIEAGSILYDATGLRAQSIELKTLGGLANLDGSFDPRTSSADLHASWSGLSLAKKTSQSGSLTATLREPFAGQPVVVVQLNDAGSVGGPTNHWSAKLNLNGQGRSWRTIDWLLTAPQLTYTGGNQSVDLSQLSAHVSQHWPIVELASLSLPASAGGTSAANFNSRGRIDFASANWNFDATGGLNATFHDVPMPVTVALHTYGDSDRYDLQSLALGAADLTITADGFYDRRIPNPVNLKVLLAQTPRVAPDAPVQGEVAGNFKIVGALFKEHGRFRPYLTTTGHLRSSDLVVFNRPIGDIDIQLEGDTATPDLPSGEPGRSVTRIHTIDFKLFKAPWDLSIDYPNADGNLEASLETRKLQLDELARFARVNDIGGELVSAKWNAVIPSANLGAIDLHSEYHLSNLNISGFTADTVDAASTLKNGMLKLDPLVAISGNGSVTTTVSLDLLNPRHLVTDTVVDRWPYSPSKTAAAVVTGQGKMDFDLKAKHLGANGSLTASTDVVIGTSTRLAHADLNASVTNRAISIDRFSGNVLAGDFNGTAKLDLDHPLQATGQLAWDNVDAAAFANVFSALDGTGGKFSGTITLAPARDPRPLEPMRVDVNVASTNGHFRSMQIGGKDPLTVHAIGYLNTDRAVLDHSDIYLAGGIMHVWGRLGYRPGTRLATQVAVDFNQLQLDQLAHIDPKLTKPIPGILGGHIGLVRSGPHSSQVLALSHLDLAQTDLGNFGPIAALYDLMHVGSGSSSGAGSVDLAFEQDVLRVTNFSYFNHGIEARGLCSLGLNDYTHLMATRVNGQLVGTARPLKNTALPFVDDFDNIFNALQGGLTTVDITGTFENPKYHQALVRDIGKTLRELLVGEAEAGNVQ